MLPASIKSEFPIFTTHPDLVYLDTAATAQKPRTVLMAMQDFYETSYANVHRGVYDLSRRSTESYENAKATVANFIGATADEIIFTKNATEGFNLLAHSLGKNLQVGDEIILSELEHHANIVPWHILRESKGIAIRVIPILDDGTLDLDAYQKLLSAKTKIVSFTGMSNALGIVPPIKAMIAAAHAVGARTIMDASQLVYHAPLDVRALDCDFMVFTGHKCYGPTGVGVVFGKRDLLNAMPPFLGGGDMIDTVAFDHITYAASPRRFEAGTPPIAEAVGLAAALQFMQNIGMHHIAAHDAALGDALRTELHTIRGITIHGSAAQSGIISFTAAHAHPQDIATLLDKQNIAIRVGHHCCMPLMQRLGTSATARISFGIYNTRDDIQKFSAALSQTLEMLS